MGMGIGVRLAAKFHFAQNDGCLYSGARFPLADRLAKQRKSKFDWLDLRLICTWRTNQNVLVKYKREAGKGSEAKVLKAVKWKKPL